MDGGAGKMRRLAILMGCVAVAGAIGVGVRMSDRWPQFANAWRNGNDTALDLSAAAGLRLEALTVEGRVNTEREDILASLDVERGTPILSIDVADAREALETLPWVKSAQVERQLPNSVHVLLQERSAYALWQRGKRYTLIDAEGTAIVDVPGQVGELPLIVGSDAPAHARELFEVLKAHPALAERVRGAVRIGERRWNIHFDSFESGIAVRMPEKDLAAAWNRLATLERDHKILERDLAGIDLRLPDRLIVQLNKDAEGQTPASKKDEKRPTTNKSGKDA
jgi:cell division protein FtsQ